MNDFLHKYLTTEAVLILGGFVWAVAGSLLPGIATIPVPAIGIPGVFQSPEFVIGPGHMIVLGIIPVALKTFKPGATPFQAATPVANPPKEEGL